MKRIGKTKTEYSFGSSIFGDSLGAFRNGMFGKFTGENETNSSLDITRTHGVLPVDMKETRGFGCNTFKGIKNKRVHDSHCFRGDT